MAAQFGLLPASAKLCGGCAWETDNHASTSIVKGDTYKGRQYKQISVVQKAAREGCWPCGLYLAAIEQLWVPDDPGFMTGQGQFYLRYDLERFAIHGQARHPVIQIYTTEGQPQAYRFPRAPELPANAASTRTLKFIRNRLQDCVQNHVSCRKAGQGLDGNWPKRILEIDPESLQVRLVGFDKSMDQRYTALSYCWGSIKPPFKLSTSTLPSLKRGVSTGTLPKTIADAIHFSLRLGCTLIWVDSLCIVQDDPRDWDEESGKMSTVYQRALVTLIASSAASCNDGFLGTERDTSVLLQQHDQQTKTRARKLSEAGHHQPPGRRRFDRSPEHRRLEPVDERGWTLQEKLLSPRCIVFTADEVQWECRTARACECGQEPPPPLTSEEEEEEEEWFDILGDYTSRSLSVDSDRLTALAGISRTMAPRGRGRFSAGIWVTPEASALTMRGLLWTRTSSVMRPSYYPRGYLAPSWSWASIVGEVSHVEAAKFSASSACSSYPSRILEVDIAAATADPFGRVAFGFVRVRGALLRAAMRCAPSSGRWRDGTVTVSLASPAVAGSSCHPDVPLERVRMPEAEAEAEAEGGFTVQRRITASMEESDRLFAVSEFPETDVFVLPILEYKTGYGRRWAEGLVLGRSPTLPGYQRLGTISFSLEGTKASEANVAEDVCIF